MSFSDMCKKRGMVSNSKCDRIMDVINESSPRRWVSGEVLVSEINDHFVALLHLSGREKEEKAWSREGIGEASLARNDISPLTIDTQIAYQL
jgi:hypothetical protein